jgi:hypothetical protein
MTRNSDDNNPSDFPRNVEEAITEYVTAAERLCKPGAIKGENIKQDLGQTISALAKLKQACGDNENVWTAAVERANAWMQRKPGGGNSIQ